MRSLVFKWPVIEAKYYQSGRPIVPPICRSGFRRVWSRTHRSSSSFHRLRLVLCNLSADRGAAAAAAAASQPAMANGASPRLLIVSDLDNTMVCFLLPLTQIPRFGFFPHEIGIFAGYPSFFRLSVPFDQLAVEMLRSKFRGRAFTPPAEFLSSSDPAPRIVWPCFD